MATFCVESCLKGTGAAAVQLAVATGAQAEVTTRKKRTHCGIGLMSCALASSSGTKMDEQMLLTRLGASGGSLAPEQAQTPADQPQYSTVQSAIAAASRASLDLLELPYPFSQIHLLSARDFAKLVDERRSREQRHTLSRMDEQVLEELHRAGVLVPLYRVDLDARAEAKAIDVSAHLTPQQIHVTVINELFMAAHEGRLVDPAAVGFEPWPTERRRTLWPTVASGYVYSRHQLLGLDAALSVIRELKPRRSEHWLTWHLDDAALPNAPTIAALETWRSLAITLTTLDTYYWPQMTHSLLGGIETWQQVLRSFDRKQTLAWLGLSLDQAQRQITSLLGFASFTDDTGDFYDLIRRAKADAWKSLRGDAAVAMDYRLAADILIRFAEDIKPDGDYAGTGHAALKGQGLSARPNSLDAALTHLHLSPFPALVIGLEGATEYKLVPRVMETLGIEWDHSRIRIVDAGGTTADLSLLARYAVEPVLGRDFGKGVALDRPLTRFLVMTDAENKYRTAADRRYQRKLLLASLTKNVPPDLRSDYYINTRRGRIVDIVTWGKLPFEFAHFTDRELADAMLGIAKAPHPQGRDRLVQNLHMQRTRDPKPNVENVFWRGAQLDKIPLAEALWPILQRKVNDAIQSRTPGPPVMRACMRAYEMMAISEKVSIMLRRRRWRPRP